MARLFGWPTAAKAPVPSPAGVPTQGPSLPLQGPRVLVRPLRRHDLDERQAWRPYNDPLYLVWDMPKCSREENDRWFAQMTDGRYRLTYGVEDLSGRMVGMLSLREIVWGDSARLGIAFSPDHIDQEYGTESLQMFLPYFFYTLGFCAMVLDVAAGNVRAVRCYQKAGFRQVSSYWQAVDGPLDLGILDRPEYAPIRSFFRWRWGRPEGLYYDMELKREEWEKEAI